MFKHMEDHAIRVTDSLCSKMEIFGCMAVEGASSQPRCKQDIPVIPEEAKKEFEQRLLSAPAWINVTPFDREVISGNLEDGRIKLMADFEAAASALIREHDQEVCA